MALAEALFGKLERTKGDAEEEETVPVYIKQLADVGIWRIQGLKSSETSV